MRCILLALIGGALMTGCGQHAQPSAASNWTAPQNPNPEKILDEAENDARSGKYADALAKQIWFFQNALKYQPGQSGVRLSFALLDWTDLGAVYPPALEKLKAFRDKAEKNVREEQNAEDNFDDFKSINKYLEEDAKTIALFNWLDSNKPDLAQKVFEKAEPALIQSKQYQLCGKYIADPDKSFSQILRRYREFMESVQKRRQDGKDVQNFTEFTKTYIVKETTTLVALLVVNGRKTEAQQIVEKMSKEPGLPEFKTEIQKALTGEVPPPWP